MDSNGFHVGNFLQSLRTKKPPWECPKCHKIYKSYSGIEYHIVKFHQLGGSLPSTPSNTGKFPFHGARKSKLKYTVRKKNNRLLRRSPSPVELLSPNSGTTLTWAEAQQMVELEANGKVYRLNISDKLDIISDSDDNSESENGAFNHTNDVKNSSEKDALVNGHQEKTISSPKRPKPVLSLPVPLNKPLTTSSQPALPKPSFQVLSDYESETTDAPPRPLAYYRYIEKAQDELEDEVEYDMDEEDAVWLELMNKHRVKEGIDVVSDNQLELLMDRFEKESYFEQAKHGLSAQSSQPLIDEDAVCCVCNDGECQNSNVILFCDMCNLAIHQECYGVPYIPEGQWLCRRCLQSPSTPVDCCLCPNRTGAFKQTDDGRWAHVVCALWIPEVGFGNTVFLEPIDGLKNVPSARWKLTCYVCKQRNAGACIQCHRTNCYTAFHVTCAQQAGLYMKMEPVKRTGENGVTITVKKEAYCDVHTPADASPRQKSDPPQENTNTESKPSDKMKKARKLLAEKRLEAPQISIPYIPRDRLVSIGRLVSIQKRSAFMQRLLSYWTLKRQSRNGVPLLRRLQSHVHSHKPHDPKAKLEQLQLLDQLNYWQRLRHDLERARLLIELLRKREKLKREDVRTSQIITELRLFPLVVLLRRVLAKLIAFDTAKVFIEPVKASDAPDYYNVIKHPMDFSTMAAKIENQDYRTVNDFENDFNLIINNCIRYNGRDTIFYRLATRMRDHGGTAIRAAKREVARTGYDDDSGMLLPKTPEKKVEETIDDEKRLSLPLKEQLDIMLVRLDQAVLRAKKTKKIRSEIAMLKRKIARENNLKKSVMDRNGTETASGSGNDEANKQVTSAENSYDDSSKSDHELEREESRKRLWSERRTSNSSQCTVKKKRMLSRSGSCPIPLQKLLHSDCLNISKDTLSLHAIDGGNSPGGKTLDPVRPSSLPASPTFRVNRRTAVLFNKKSRARFPISFIKDAATIVKDVKPFDIDVGAKNENIDKANSSGVGSVPSPAKIEKKQDSETSVSPNADSSQMEVKNEKSFQVYRDDSVSRSASESDAESACSSEYHPDHDKSLEKDSRSVLVHLRDAYRSDGSSSEVSDDEHKPDLEDSNAVSDGSVDKHSSTSEDEFDSSDMPYISPLDLVWAKCWGYPPYPALLIDPKMPRSGYCHNGVPIPVPPLDVLQAGEDKRKENGNRKIYLVLFFDTKRTWQWLPRNKLEPLGIDNKSDQAKLAEGRRPGVKKNVVAAYNRALLHRSKVTGEIPDSDDEPVPGPSTAADRSSFNGVS